MNTAPTLGKAAAIASTGPTKAAAAPRIKLSSHGISIDHPDQGHGERLMSEALGVADRDAVYGIPPQLVKASVNGRKPCAFDPACKTNSKRAGRSTSVLRQNLERLGGRTRAR